MSFFDPRVTPLRSWRFALMRVWCVVGPPVRREAAPPPRLGRGEGSEADERALFAAAPTDIAIPVFRCKTW